MPDTVSLKDIEDRQAYDERVVREGGTLSNGQEIYTLAERAQIREEIRQQIAAAEAAFDKKGRRGLHPRVAAIREEAGLQAQDG